MSDSTKPGPPSESLYDRDDYYGPDANASRLAPFLTPLLYWLDDRRARSLCHKIHLSAGALAHDTGAGNGSFVAALKRRGLIATGTTLSQAAALGAKRSLSVDLEVSDRLVQRQGGYDVITYWHVFEHLHDADDHLAQCHAALKPGGYLIVEVPNPEGIGARLAFSSWLGSDPVHHVRLYTETELTALLTKHGLQPFKTERTSLKFTYVYLWSALLGAAWPGLYPFDGILDLLKRPVSCLRRQPFRTMNAFAALLYFAPVAAALAILGLATKRGEIIRIYAKSA